MRFEVGDRFGPGRVHQVVREIVLGDVVIVRHVEGSLEQRSAVLPVLRLGVGQSRAHQAGECGCCRERESIREEFRHSPGEHDQEADHREVHVPVGSGLQSHLYDSDNRDQHAEKPEPAGGEIRTLAPLVNDAGGDGDEKHQGGDRLPGGGRVLIWVEGRQSGGPEGLSKIDHVGDQRVLHADHQRDGLDGFRLTLDQERDHRHGSGESGTEGQLLQPARTTAKRPDIEEQQGEREGHQHRLGHQSESEGRANRRYRRASGRSA